MHAIHLDSQFKERVACCLQIDHPGQLARFELNGKCDKCPFTVEEMLAYRSHL